MTAWLSTAANGIVAAATQDYARAASFDHAGWTIHCEPSGCVVPASNGVRVAAGAIVSKGTTTLGARPAARPLFSGSKSGSTTLTWVVGSLDGAQDYGVNLALTAIGTTPFSYDLTVKNLTIVVEGTPA